MKIRIRSNLCGLIVCWESVHVLLDDFIEHIDCERTKNRVLASVKTKTNPVR